MINYVSIKNYKEKKLEFLSQVKQVVGYIPEGYTNDKFCSAVIKLFEFLEAKYPNRMVAVEEIPDAQGLDLFQRKVSLKTLIFRRLLVNVKSFSIEKKDDENPYAMGGYNHMERKIVLFSKLTKKHFKRLKSRKVDALWEKRREFKKTILEKTVIHELLHAISDNGNMCGFGLNVWHEQDFACGISTEQTRIVSEGITECIALKVSSLKGFLLSTFRSFKNKVGENIYYQTPTNGGYKLRVNILSLFEFISDDDLIYEYLVCPEYFYREENDKLSLIIKMANALEKAKDKENPEFQGLQEVQADLLVFAIDKVRGVYEEKTKLDSLEHSKYYKSKEFKMFKAEVESIVKNVILTFNANKLTKYLASKGFNDFYYGNLDPDSYIASIIDSSEIFKSSRTLKEFVNHGIIEPTANVLLAIELLNMIERFKHEEKLASQFSVDNLL